MNLRKKIISLLVCLIALIFMLAGCSFENSNTETKITSINLENNNEERIEWSIWKEGFDEFKGRFTVTPKTVDCEDLQIVFDNENIIEKSSIDKGIIKNDFVYKIKAKYTGKVTMYISSKDNKCKSELKTFIFAGGPNDPNKINKIGESVTDEYYNVEYKVTDVINSKSFSNGYYSINTNYNFLLVTIEIKNQGKKAFYVSPNNFTVNKYENDIFISKYEYDTRTYNFENGMSSYDLNYGIKKSFVILFEIDKSTKLGDYRIVCQGVSNKSSVVIHLKD